MVGKGEMAVAGIEPAWFTRTPDLQSGLPP